MAIVSMNTGLPARSAIVNVSPVDTSVSGAVAQGLPARAAAAGFSVAAGAAEAEVDGAGSPDAGAADGAADADAGGVTAATGAVADAPGPLAAAGGVAVAGAPHAASAIAPASAHRGKPRCHRSVRQRSVPSWSCGVGPLCRPSVTRP